MLELIPKLDVGRICNPKHPRLDLNKEHYVCYGIQTVVINLLIICLYKSPLFYIPTVYMNSIYMYIY